MLTAKRKLLEDMRAVLVRHNVNEVSRKSGDINLHIAGQPPIKLFELSKESIDAELKKDEQSGEVNTSDCR